MLLPLTMLVLIPSLIMLAFRSRQQEILLRAAWKTQRKSARESHRQEWLWVEERLADGR